MNAGQLGCRNQNDVLLQNGELFPNDVQGDLMGMHNADGRALIVGFPNKGMQLLMYEVDFGDVINENIPFGKGYFEKTGGRPAYGFRG